MQKTRNVSPSCRPRLRSVTFVGASSLPRGSIAAALTIPEASTGCRDSDQSRGQRQRAVYISEHIPTRAEAVDAVGKLAGSDLSDRFNLTFADVYEFWRAERCEGANGLTEKGKESYAVAYKHFAGLKDKKFRSLKTADYQKVVDEQIAAEKSRSSTEKDRQLISQLCKWAMREETITVNYAQFLNLAKSEKVEKPTFNELEVAKIEKAAPTSDAAKLVVMLLSTGMRIGELFSLPAIDVHDSYCIGGEKTEAGRNRVIPIRPEGRAYFQYFKRRSGDDRLLVEGYSGNQNARNFRNRDYYDLLEQLELKKEPTLRGTPMRAEQSKKACRASCCRRF